MALTSEQVRDMRDRGSRFLHEATVDDGMVLGHFAGGSSVTLGDVFDTLDATRAKLAETERERDEARAEIAYAVEHGVPGLVATAKEGIDRTAALYTTALAAAQAEAAELREALYPLVVGCLAADANEDAPEFVNDEAYTGARALPECGRCCGSGSTDGTEYVDVPIPEALRCPDCGGWGFLKSAPGGTEALRAFAQKVADHAFDIHRNGGCGQCEAVDIAIARLLDPTGGEKEGQG